MSPRKKQKYDECGMDAEEQWRRTQRKTKTYFCGKRSAYLKKHLLMVNNSTTNLLQDNKMKVYPIGLVAATHFYRYNKKINYVVGVYSGAQPMSQLYVQDFHALRVEKKDSKEIWLSNFAIDICLHVLQKRCHSQTINVFTNDETLNIFNNPIEKQLLPECTEIWILPLLKNGNH